MNRTALVNLAILRRRHLEESLAPIAVEVLAKAARPNSRCDLEWLLRDYAEEPIESPTEIRRRDAFDDLLAYYGLLEIASSLQLVPTPLPAADADAALAHLSVTAVRAYYEEYYPVPLATRFRRRLERGAGRRFDSAAAASTFSRFLDISSLIECTGQRRNPEVETFLWFLDDGNINRKDIDDVLRSLARPHTFVRLMTRADLRGEPVARALRGFRAFLLFSMELDALLQEVAPPALAETYWLYHAYWFERMRNQVGRTMRQALDALLSWDGPRSTVSRRGANPTVGDMLHASRRRAATRASILAARTAVRRLTCAKYALVRRR